MGSIIFGIILIVVGLGCIFYLKPKIQRNLLEIQYMKTTSIPELYDMFAQMADAGMSDTYRQYTELKGSAFVNNPVNTPFSNQKVAYCDSKLSQVTEQRESYKDSNGVLRERMTKKENTISSEKSTETVYLKNNDSDKRVVLELSASGLKLDIPKSFDRFESRNNLGGYSFFNHYSWNRNDASTLGFKMVEKTIKENQPLYVIGEAFKNGDEIYIGKPMDNKKPFIVSTKSEDDLINTSKNNATFALIGGIAAIIIGVVMLLIK